MDYARHDHPPRQGGFLDRLVDLGRRLRGAGLPVDASRIALAAQAAQLVGVHDREDLCAALESVLVQRPQDRRAFLAIFDAWCSGAAPAAPAPAAHAPGPSAQPPAGGAAQAQGDAARGDGPDTRSVSALAASARRRLRHADFGTLPPEQYRLVEQLARATALSVPGMPGRRLQPAPPGRAHARMHWRGVLREAALTGGEMLRLPQLQRRQRALPVLALVDVSGSMERYARVLLAFLHAAAHGLAARGGRLDVFAFGTGLSDLTPAFRARQARAMLRAAEQAIEDYGGGTRTGESLARLRRQYAHRLSGRRTLVLLISDGLDTGDPDALRGELQWLKRHSRRLLWLNPLMRVEGYAPLARGAGALARAADAMLAVHDLDALETLSRRMCELLGRAG